MLRACPIAEGRVIEENHVHNFVAEYNHTWSKSLLTARIGFARTPYVYNNQGLGFKPSSPGLPATTDAAVDRQMFPRFGASGFVSLGGNDHRHNEFMSYPWLVAYTRSTTKHTFKTGFDGRMLRVNVWEARAAGTFGFSAGMTQGPNPATASGTAGHSIASLLLGTGTTNNVLIQNWKYDVAASNTIASYDIPHRFVCSVLYELPFGRGRRFGNGWHALVDGVAGGWQINGVVMVQTGPPLGITASNTANIFSAVTRPNWNGNDPVLAGSSQDRLQRWFDTTVFSQPPAYTFGNIDAAFGRLRADGVRNLDLSLFKHFALHGRMRLQARVEAFNALNRVQFSGPNTSVTSGSFGIVSSRANAPRQLQFGVKVLW